MAVENRPTIPVFQFLCTTIYYITRIKDMMLCGFKVLYATVMLSHAQPRMPEPRKLKHFYAHTVQLSYIRSSFHRHH